MNADVDPNLNEEDPWPNGRAGCFVLICIVVFFLLVWLLSLMFDTVP